MRIIAGKWRHRQIEAPESDQTRPILDRAKTVLFDMLGHRLALPGTLPPIAVLDLFAGSGALGIEALSRGARYCMLVEQHRATARLIRRNLDTLGVIDEAEILQGDAVTCQIPPPPTDDLDPPGDTIGQYELIFVDPPYRMLSMATPPAAIRKLLSKLATEPAIADSALIVLRHAAGQQAPDLAPLVELDRKIVGTMMFRFMTRPQAGDSTASEDPS